MKKIRGRSLFIIPSISLKNWIWMKCEANQHLSLNSVVMYQFLSFTCLKLCSLVSYFPTDFSLNKMNIYIFFPKLEYDLFMNQVIDLVNGLSSRKKINIKFSLARECFFKVSTLKYYTKHLLLISLEIWHRALNTMEYFSPSH